MINKIKFIAFINLLFIVCFGQYSSGMESEEFKEISVSNSPRSSYFDVKFWKNLEEEHVAVLMVTHERLPTEWKLHYSFEAKEGGVHVYSRTSDERIEESKEFKKKLNKFFKFFQQKPDIYYKIRNYERALLSLPQQAYESYPLEALTQSLKEADNIIFALGAGISASTIPDLSTGMNNLELIQIPSTDTATYESYKVFAERLVTETAFRKSFIQSMEEFSEKLYFKEKRSPTEAHFALAQIIKMLKEEERKTVRIYSSNIDELEKEVGIELDETSTDNEEVGSIVPSYETLEGKRTTVVSIGKSFDHDGDLSKLHALLSEIKDHTYEFFSLNLKSAPIIGYKNVYEVNVPSEDELFVIPMKLIEGDIQVTVPALEKALNTPTNL